MTDHHHLARALSDAQIEHAYAQIMADLSNQRRCLLARNGGQGMGIPLRRARDIGRSAAISKQVSSLIDDSYRSLAAFVRDTGGYTKTPEPFADFQWAAFFRTRIRMWTTTFQFTAAVQQAVLWREVQMPSCCQASMAAQGHKIEGLGA